MSSIGNLPQTLIDDPQRRIHILLVHHQRRREAQRAPPRPEQQQAFAKRAFRQVVRDLWRRLARGAVLTNSTPTIRPRPRTSPIAAYFASRRRAPASSRSPSFGTR